MDAQALAQMPSGPRLWPLPTRMPPRSGRWPDSLRFRRSAVLTAPRRSWQSPALRCALHPGPAACAPGHSRPPQGRFFLPWAERRKYPWGPRAPLATGARPQNCSGAAWSLNTAFLVSILLVEILKTTSLGSSGLAMSSLMVSKTFFKKPSS